MFLETSHHFYFYESKLYFGLRGWNVEITEIYIFQNETKDWLTTTILM